MASICSCCIEMEAEAEAPASATVAPASATEVPASATLQQTYLSSAGSSKKTRKSYSREMVTRISEYPCLLIMDLKMMTFIYRV